MKSHGGFDNAYTTFEETNYYFDIGSEFLEESLDRFAQFFISPLFTESATEREMKAVDSEYSKNLQKDSWRYDQFERSKLNPDHPASKLGIGNIQTLKEVPEAKGINIRNELLAFHAKYYSANLMRLVVLGKESLDLLQQWVTEKYGEIANSNRDPEPEVLKTKEGGLIPVLLPSQTKKVFSFVPVGELMEVRMSFALPSLNKYYHKKPEDYLSHLIGHEGEGSILALLKSKGWANELISGPSRIQSDHETFEVQVKLTAEGLKSYKEVISHVFQYIRLLRQSGFPKWIFDEVAKVRSLDFQFQDMFAPSHYVTYLASNMQKYQPEHVLSGPYLASEYDHDLIASVCGNLIPSNLRVFLASKQFEGTTDKVEEWYKITYSERDIEEADLKVWYFSPFLFLFFYPFFVLIYYFDLGLGDLSYRFRSRSSSTKRIPSREHHT
jgi:insulysin